MKWIASRRFFLIEKAKIKDVILSKQAKHIKKQWGEEWLDLEEVIPTSNIEQGKWKLSEEDKRKVLGIFLMADIDKVYSIFENLPEMFIKVINDSIDIDLFKENVDNWTRLLTDFDISKPTINQIGILTDPIFKKMSVGETMASEIIVRDDAGRPIMGEDNRPKKIAKEIGKVIYSRNLTNINSFVEDYNRCFDNKVDASIFTSGDISRLVSNSKHDFGGDNYNVDIDIYGRDLYLSIKHNPKDILNMSISRFYSSCQSLYTGGWRERVLSNVFDPNSIPAYFIFESNIYDSDGDLISEQLPLSRIILRNLETFNIELGQMSSVKIFFDRSYPDRMQDIITSMIEKYTSNKNNNDLSIRYIFAPDIPTDLSLSEPYMDKLEITRGKYIGVNSTNLYIKSGYDWSRTIISPNANIKTIVIETVSIPENLFKMVLNPDFLKFKSIKINTLEPFKKIKTKSLIFERCKILDNALVNTNDIENLEFIACEIDDIKLSNFGKINELKLLYTIDSDKLISVLEGISFKKLVLSSDIISKENNNYINALKKKGIKVEIHGPKI